MDSLNQNICGIKELCVFPFFAQQKDAKTPFEQPIKISVDYDPEDNTINFNLKFLNGDIITSLSVCMDALALESVSRENEIPPDIPVSKD